MMRPLLSVFRCGHLDRKGASMVEFALIAPVLISLLGGAVDLGSAIEHSIRVESAARAAAQYITRMPTDGTGAQTAGSAVVSGLAGASVTVAAMDCRCPPTGAATGGAVVACTASCASGMQQYVTVSASAPFTPIFPASYLLPWDNLASTSANVVVRLR